MPQKKHKNLLINVLINVVIPVVVLTRFSGENYLGPLWGLVTALAFPVVYGIWDFAKERKVNFFSGLGFISVLLTGGIGVLELPTKWIVVKETAVPLIIATAILLSQKTRVPLVKTFFSEIFNLEKIQNGFKEPIGFEKMLGRSTYFLTGAFLLSALLNFILAVVIMNAEPGTAEYNQQLGKMTGLSFPVIVLPTVVVLTAVMYRMIEVIKKETGMEMEEYIK
ncbi:MAG: MFS transporter [Candidatus Doudnabacteria bacterium CG10_big_fil_rev_8_21_14_0_10_41_10]|uniref:MFS transporter n=1 Tax=Candidatus Doudnabacteria bacterium CG10_big_fil_rev_8_21_14_0_10_41_10 TaxID=1974551 RepID=A0A2H0VCZ7_9BACT|nr:MAG: MFS transporter [Candidatus Doudnabacteria bacterium CG10_big_fil_rev_8_21_14_0_10_41_10]